MKKKEENNYSRINIISFIFFILFFIQCNNHKEHEIMTNQVRIIFFHHSTGKQIWRGGVSKVLFKITKYGNVQKWFKKYNRTHKTDYLITEQVFPKKEPYGWNNYPYDYYNIWVKNAGNEPYKNEPTLEILTKRYDLIIWKHCFPVGNIQESNDLPVIDSPARIIANYKLQYNALKKKMHEFHNTRFLVWTGAALVKNSTTDEAANRTKLFFDWVKDEWDEKGDNIFLWDFYELETEGGLYLKNEYAENLNNSHPSGSFAKRVYPFFCKRIVDVLEDRGDKEKIRGK